KIPMGAIVLILLGVLFLLHTMGLGLGFDRFWPLILIFIGGWMFVRNWSSLGSHAPDCDCSRCRTRRMIGPGLAACTMCQCARCRTRRIMGPTIVVTIGVLFLLENLHVGDLGFHRTWPVILLVIGAIKLLQGNASMEGHIPFAGFGAKPSVGGGPNPPVASPMMTPPPPPTPPRVPHRSMAGPVVLILLGVLFLLGTMGVLNWHGLWALFGRYWPALLILWGVLKLIEHEQAKRSGQPVRGIGVGGVFLMLFLITGGLIATQLSRLDLKSLGEHIQIGDEQDLDEIFGGSTFDYSDELSQEIPAGSTLHVNDDRGTITINVGDSKTMKVSVRKKVRAEQEKDAENYNGKTKPQITVADKLVTLNANTKGAGDKGVTADMDIYVSANT